jgi:hypothetical protein
LSLRLSHLNIVEASAYEPLDVVQRVFWVFVDLVFSRLTNQSLGIREGDPRRCCSLTEVIRDDFNVAFFEHSDAAFLFDAFAVFQTRASAPQRPF